MPFAADEHEAGLSSDEEVQAARVDTVVPHNAAIALAEYDPQWPALFEREAARIREILGGTAMLVEHVGSTSVPGLAAKPIIDIVLAVPDSADEAAYVPALEAAGYVLRIREPDWFEHRMFRGPDTLINLHVFTAGAAEIDRMLLFRDWLRADEVMRLLHGACEQGVAAVMVTHDAQLASWADRVVFLRDGQLIDQTAPLTGPDSLLMPDVSR